MKRILFSIILMMLALSLQAQIANCPTTQRDGKEMYVYTVQKGEGLYRISKNFGVSQEDIIRNNPELEHRGLRIGQTLYIPITHQVDSTAYIIHEIHAKETLYGLSRKYGVSIADIQALNPETTKRMPIGARLLIPKKEEEETRSTEANVKPANTNPETGKPSTTFVQERVTIVAKDTTQLLQIDTLIQRAFAILPSDSIDTPLRIAYLLPLMSNQVKRTTTSDRFLEFYEGALLALQELQQQDRRFEIFVYDTEKSDVRIKQILAQIDTLKIDAIIGPAYPSQISYVAHFAQTHQIPTLIPFTSKVDGIAENPYLLQFNPAEESQIDSVVAHCIRTYPTGNYIFVQTTDKPATSTTLLQQGLKQQQASILTITANEMLHDSLPLLLQAEREHIIIFDTEKYAQLTPLIQKIQTYQSTYSLTLLAQYGWSNEEIPMRHFYASVFNPSRLLDLPLAIYELQFKHFFGNELTDTMPRYDLLGYDLTRCLIDVLHPDHTNNYKGLQSDIRFRRVSEQGGYENTSIQIINR